MTNNPFAMPDPADQGGFLLSPAGVLVLAAGAIHAGDSTAEGKARSMRLIVNVLLHWSWPAPWAVRASCGPCAALASAWARCERCESL